MSKLAEGGFNRTFLITLRDDFQMVARIAYLVTVPKYYAVASEVAIMEFLRSSGLPVPQAPSIRILAYVGQRGEDREHYGIYERYETQRCMAGTG